MKVFHMSSPLTVVPAKMALGLIIRDASGNNIFINFKKGQKKKCIDQVTGVFYLMILSNKSEQRFLLSCEISHSKRDTTLTYSA